MKERSILRFEQGIKSRQTLNNYRDHLKNFRNFAEFDSFDGLIAKPVEEIQTLVEDYLIHLKENRHPNSIPILFLGVRHFFVMNRIPLYWDIIRKMYPPKIKSAGFKPWTTEKIQKMLAATTSKRNRAIIHFLASTGARIGVIDGNFTLKYIHDMPEGCKAVLLYPNDNEEYWAFLTPEATQALDEYHEERRQKGEELTDNSPVFRRDYSRGKKVLPMQRSGVISVMYRVINNAGLERTKVNHHFDTQMDHGFRKRFNTILKLKNSVNSNVAEKLLGHKNGLDGVYLKPTREQCFAEFRKAIVELMIDDSERQRLKIKQLEREKSELEHYRTKVDELWQDKLRMEHVQLNHA
ncbi:tyrosine-type recombinase/integrase [Nitrosopumilus maritimus]|uniref:Integrase family protein n=1 Tax=Nitrosopumilus maritimus (strain SCM1) TaxID=436308 RepID=A9A5W0_NITMS|nr:site-specific integrase [Nitrosopumilus maritimus]ABX13115.1 integrase family protein [Nitrosopumilus maritimus SCM1]